MSKKKSEINFTIEMDENKVPEKIHWDAEGSEKGDGNLSRAIMLALWDQEENNTLRIDLWTKDMMVDEMKKFTCQNIITLADSFERATGEQKVAEEIRQFGKDIAIRLGVLKGN
ncbi:MAG: gliding motility protein GldC [Vicingaceae bacterium]